jgi:hypothetical protein
MRDEEKQDVVKQVVCGEQTHGDGRRDEEECGPVQALLL